MATWPPLDTFAITASLSQTLAQPVHGIRVLDSQERLYSHVWTLDATTANGPQRILVKAWRDPITFHNQVKALQRAHAPFAARDDVCIPYLGTCPQQRLLLMPWIPDPPVSTLLKFPADSTRGWNPRTWKQDLLAACTRMGKWLCEWHTATRDYGPVDRSLACYLGQREDELALLTPTDRRQLQALIASLEEDTTCVAHGDFTPPNVLWSPQRLTVLDFGISESEGMSPYWDQVTMEIGLIRGLRFSLKSPGTWLTSLIDAAIDAFRSGYGPSAGSPRVHCACRVIRHLVCYANDHALGKRYRRRAAWHLRQLSSALAAVDSVTENLGAGISEAESDRRGSPLTGERN